MIVAIVFVTNNCIAQQDYEPGVILLKLKNPESVKLKGNRVVNGSASFQAVLNRVLVPNGIYGGYRLLTELAGGNSCTGWFRLGML